MRQGDYNSHSSQSSYYNNIQYPQNPNPNPNPTPPVDHQPTSPLYASPYASAPPFSGNYPPSSDNYAAYPSNYPSFPHNTDPVPSLSPTAPSYSSNPNLQAQYNPPPPQSQPSFPQFESHVPYQSHSYYPLSYDQHQSNASANYNSMYNFDSGVKLGQSGYGQSGGDLGLGRYDSDGYGGGGGGGGGYGEGVYAYQGSKSEPYGATGTGSKSSTWSSEKPTFDDFGRPISFPTGKSQSSVTTGKIVRAVPKADSEQDSRGGVQKFRVKLLAESGGQSTMDVLCQVWM